MKKKKNFPDSWEYYGENDSFTWEKNEINNGHYLRIDVPRKRARKEGAYIISDFIPINADKTYTVSVMLKAEKLNIKIWTCGYNKQDEESLVFRAQKDVVSHHPENWQEYKRNVKFLRPGMEYLKQFSVNYARVKIYCYGANAGSIYIDEVKLWQKEE